MIAIQSNLHGIKPLTNEKVAGFKTNQIPKLSEFSIFGFWKSIIAYPFKNERK
jgi:hypothetical protein